MSEDEKREEARLKKRWAELSNKSYAQNIYLFTDFLNLAEQEIFWQCASDFSQSGFRLSGGYDQAERVMIGFGNPQELGYEMEFPIQCIEISPLQRKFSEELTHRDYLGALMNLGIDRCTTGDILIEDGTGYLFCNAVISPFIMENLTKIRHTSVKCKSMEQLPAVLKREPVLQELTVASLRIDAVIARLYNIARSSGTELFLSGRIWVNGRRVEKTSLLLKDGDMVSVRGYGKFVFYGQQRQTKKGRLCVAVGRYV